MLYDLFLEILHTVWKNGLGLTALGTVVYVLLKQRRVKKRLKKYFPWLLEDESETKHYIENQQRIEYKVDLLLKERGIEWHAPTLPINSKAIVQRKYKLSQSRWITSLTALFAGLFTNWRMKKMKNYLKKLGRTKFQALIASLIVNGVSAYLFLTGTLDIDGVLNTWMPIINLTVGTISTWVYIIVEGSIDKKTVPTDSDGSEYHH